MDNLSSKNLSTSNTAPLFPMVSAPKQHQGFAAVLFAGMLEDLAAPIKHTGVAEVRVQRGELGPMANSLARGQGVRRGPALNQLLESSDHGFGKFF